MLQLNDKEHLNLGDSADEYYQHRLEIHQDDLQRTKKALRYLRLVRRGLMYAIGVSLAAAYLHPEASTGWLVAIAVTACGVVVASWVETIFQSKLIHARNMVRINRAGISRRTRDWESLPEYQVSEENKESPLATDLDLFGQGSLMQLVCTAESEDGRSTLVRWLVSQANPDQLKRRQGMVKALSPQIQWRQDFQRRCILIGENPGQTQRFKDWGAKQSDDRLPSLVRGYVVALRILVPVALGVTFLHPATGFLTLVGILLANIALTVAYSGHVHSYFVEILVTSRATSYRFLSDTFSHIGTVSDHQGMPVESIATCQNAVAGLRKLERILALQSIARNALSVAVIFLPLQLIFLWDMQMHVLASHWQQRYGKDIGEWLALLGEVEAISSFASLSYEQPTWGFPEVEESGSASFVAEGLGHPLLLDDCRVTNDLSVGPPGSLLLITGSNMGGKSTLLRSIGVNVVLAQAGAPCCCSRLQMSPLHLMTSMKVSDSLSDSTSFFMAQLLSLKTIVDHLKTQQGNQQGTAVLYLFDEVLSGTNTTDRRVAAEGLIEYLLQCFAIGVMTTHDLEIATDSKHKAFYHTHHMCHQLSEESGEGALKFDYKLRPGVAPSSNALMLFRLLGIPGTERRKGPL